MRNYRKVTVSIICALVLSLTASSCWKYTTSTNTVVGGNIAYVYFRRVASNNVVDQLHYGLHGGNARTTLSDMHGFALSNLFKSQLAGVGFYISGFEYFFHSDNDADFAEAAWRVNGTSRCLVMHRNGNPWGDRHNWTYRNSSDQHCTLGKGFI